MDAFADGMHQIGQYRDAGDNVAGRVLRLCAERLDDREKEGRRRALGGEESSSTSTDPAAVLRSLSRLER